MSASDPTNRGEESRLLFVGSKQGGIREVVDAGAEHCCFEQWT
jgi:hypothetical protein